MAHKVNEDAVDEALKSIRSDTRKVGARKQVSKDELPHGFMVTLGIQAAEGQEEDHEGDEDNPGNPESGEPTPRGGRKGGY